MTTTTQKHRNFITEPMAEKPVTALAGVGQVYGSRLESLGFDKAYVVLGQFLVLKQDKKQFTEWIKKNIGMSDKYANNCYDCLKQWCKTFL